MNYRVSLLLAKNSASLCSYNAILWFFWPTLSLSMHIPLSLHYKCFSPTPILAMLASFLGRVWGKEQLPHSRAVISKCLEIAAGQNQSVSIWQFSQILYKEAWKKKSLASTFSLPVPSFCFYLFLIFALVVTALFPFLKFLLFSLFSSFHSSYVNSCFPTSFLPLFLLLLFFLPIISFFLVSFLSFNRTF